MDFDKMTIGDIRQIKNMFGEKQESHSLRVGDKVLIRTVTFHYLGKIEKVTDCDIVLSQASWVADGGYFSLTLGEGIKHLKEVEPMPHGATINRAAIVDFSPWMHDLPDRRIPE
jgi:hypothetical protein